MASDVIPQHYFIYVHNVLRNHQAHIRATISPSVIPKLTMGKQERIQAPRSSD